MYYTLHSLLRCYYVMIEGLLENDSVGFYQVKFQTICESVCLSFFIVQNVFYCLENSVVKYLKHCQ